MVDRTNPWADAGNQAVGALFKHYMSQPSQADIQNAQSSVIGNRLKNDLMRSNLQTHDLQRDNIRSQMGAHQFDLNQKRRQSEFADMFSNALNEAPQVGAETPLLEGQMGPNIPVTRQDRNTALGDIFEQYGSRLDKDTISGARDALGTANALRFDDPIQRQLAVDEKASSYDAYSPDYTLSPGSVRFDANNQQIASAPFKSGGGSFVTLPDGTEISLDGGQPPKLDPTKTVTNNLQQDQVANAKMRGLMANVRELAMKDPTNFGFPGFVKGMAQDSTALLQGIGSSMGYDNPNNAIADAQQQIGGAGVDPSLLSGIFDPDLPALQTASDLLVFQAASALASQSGRGLSDKDVQYFKQIVGSPQDIFSNQERFLAKLDTISKILGINENVADTSLGGNVTGPASGQPTGVEYDYVPGQGLVQRGQ